MHIMLVCQYMKIHHHLFLIQWITGKYGFKIFYKFSFTHFLCMYEYVFFSLYKWHKINQVYFELANRWLNNQLFSVPFNGGSGNPELLRLIGWKDVHILSIEKLRYQKESYAYLDNIQRNMGYKSIKSLFGTILYEGIYVFIAGCIMPVWYPRVQPSPILESGRYLWSCGMIYMVIAYSLSISIHHLRNLMLHYRMSYSNTRYMILGFITFKDNRLFDNTIFFLEVHNVLALSPVFAIGVTSQT